MTIEEMEKVEDVKVIAEEFAQRHVELMDVRRRYRDEASKVLKAAEAAEDRVFKVVTDIVPVRHYTLSDKEWSELNAKREAINKLFFTVFDKFGKSSTLQLCNTSILPARWYAWGVGGYGSRPFAKITAMAREGFGLRAGKVSRRAVSWEDLQAIYCYRAEVMKGLKDEGMEKQAELLRQFFASVPDVRFFNESGLWVPVDSEKVLVAQSREATEVGPLVGVLFNRSMWSGREDVKLVARGKEHLWNTSASPKRDNKKALLNYAYCHEEIAQAEVEKCHRLDEWKRFDVDALRQKFNRYVLLEGI